MGTDRYDDALIQILQAEGKILPFLDVVFGFLQRRTDFYHEHSQPSAVGFPPGVAEQLVVTTFRKWMQVQREMSAVPPPVAAEEEVVTSESEVETPPSAATTAATAAAAMAGDVSGVRKADAKVSSGASASTTPPAAAATTATAAASGDRRTAQARRAADTHNGAACDSYSWSQTIADLTVQVPVPPDVRRARQVDVELTSDRVSVRLASSSAASALGGGGGGEKELMAGRLHRPIRAEESTWSLLPGEGVQLSLEKSRESWWKALLLDEPEIDLAKIEAVKPWEDLSEEEQMKVNELRAREEAKRNPGAAGATGGGAKDVTSLLKEAWDAEGSPFKGQPYDPAAVQIIPGEAATGPGEP